MGLLLGSSIILAPKTIWSMAGFDATYTDQGAATQTYAVQVVFHTDGTVDVFRDIAADLPNEVNPYVDPTVESSNTWVQCHFISGDHMTAGAAEETWWRLDVIRTFTMRHTSAGGTDLISGTFDFTLSSDASGSPVEAVALSRTITAGESF